MVGSCKSEGGSEQKEVGLRMGNVTFFPKEGWDLPVSFLPLILRIDEVFFVCAMVVIVLLFNIRERVVGCRFLFYDAIIMRNTKLWDRLNASGEMNFYEPRLLIW